MRFTDHYGEPAKACPTNPNGSTGGSTSGLMVVTTADGRFTAVMPSAELVYRNILLSWTPVADNS